MKIFAYILLWSVVWAVAFAINVYLGDFLDEVEIAKGIKALVMALPTGLCVGIGVALHGRMKIYFKNSIQKG